MDSDVTLSIEFPQNQNRYKNFSLLIDPSKTVADLRQAIARRLYLKFSNIEIIHNFIALNDNKVKISTLIKQSLIFSVCPSEPNEEVIRNAPPIKVGGLDLTNVKQIQAFLNERNQEGQRKKLPSPQTEQRTSVQSQVQTGEIDYKVKYNKQLKQLKSQLEELGINMEEDTLVTYLIHHKGKVEIALNAIIDSLN